MKCKGSIIEKKSLFEKKVKVCNNQLADHQIFCDKCGTSTGVLSKDLSAKQNWKQAWNQFKPEKASYYAFSIFMIICIFSFIGLSAVMGSQYFWYNNLVLLFIVPLALIPFSFESNFLTEPFTIKKFFQYAQHYPKLFLFVLINIAFFIFLKILCTGAFLNIATDPILHEVRLILVLYWIAIVLPAPILMIRKKMNPLKAIIVSYKAGSETRWQQFFVVFFLFCANLLGLALAGLGLLVTIPFTYIIIERYYLRMDEYELFDTEGRGHHVQEKS
ncbi:hypothetical protein ACFLYJ_01940 [Candidatus Cloacimonadota bacterium]